MVKVNIIGSREIWEDDPFSIRAKSYLKAFKALGADVEYDNIKKFHYHVAGKGMAIYNEGRRFAGTDVIFILSAATKYLLSYYELFRLLGSKAKVIVNSPESFLTGKNKFLTGLALQRAGVAVPDTRLVTGLSWRNVIDRLEFPVVVKKVFGSRGVGVMKFDSYSSLSSFFDFHFSQNRDPHGLIVQKFIKESNATDYRVVVVNGKAILTMRRKGNNPDKNFRSNVAQGARPSEFRTTPEMAAIAVKAAQALGLFLAGVDIMEAKDGYKVLEVNSTPFIEVEQAVTGRNLFGTIAAECLSLIQKKPH